MKKFIVILFLILTFQSTTQADDISDFQIEGMSIGDSALDFFSESEIKNNMRYLYKSKKYAQFGKLITHDSIYEGIYIEFKDNGKYIIESLIGKIFYHNKDFNKCSKKESIILDQLKNLFKKNASYKDHGIKSHEGDPSGKSKGSWHTFKLNDGSGWVYLECMNWSEEAGYYDNLRITILGSEFGRWLQTEGY